MYKARMVLDSIGHHGIRLSTMELTYPRIVHSEMLTHRDRARNSASSRAIPFSKMLTAVMEDPFVPLAFGSKQAGMQMGNEVVDQVVCRGAWLSARDAAIDHAKVLDQYGVHKSICNRLLEPWMWITVIMTATDWENLFRLRCHEDAEIHIQKICYMAKDLLADHQPVPTAFGQWHLPYVQSEEFGNYDIETLKKVSVARCARVSYLTHDGVCDVVKDLELFERLVTGSGFGHWSPHEHVAQCVNAFERSGPFRGWKQYRKTFAGECG